MSYRARGTSGGFDGDEGAGLTARGHHRFLDQGSGIDPNGLDAGGAMDPNGRPLGAGIRIDPNGGALDDGRGIDPNGGALGQGSMIDPDGLADHHHWIDFAV